MANEKHRKTDAGAIRSDEAPARYSELLAVWSRLDESSQTKFFAALLHAAMAKPATQSELGLRLVTMDDWDRRIIAGLDADLSDQSTDG